MGVTQGGGGEREGEEEEVEAWGSRVVKGFGWTAFIYEWWVGGLGRWGGGYGGCRDKVVVGR